MMWTPRARNLGGHLRILPPQEKLTALPSWGMSLWPSWESEGTRNSVQTHLLLPAFILSP